MRKTTNMRSGFTMIELIFVIVIIGILAAVAIPKLAATRDDAENAKKCSNATTCLSDLATSYTATGAADEAGSAACVDDAEITLAGDGQSASYSGNIDNCKLSTTAVTFGGSSVSI